MVPPQRPSREALATLYAVATLAAWWAGPDGPVYWDSFGYVTQAVTGRVGGLLLGRPTFVLASHALASAWRSLGGSVWSVEPLLRAAWTLASATAAPAMACVASRAGLSSRAAWWAGLLLALSPAVAHTSRAVLTDAPSMAVSLMAFAMALRAAAEASPSRMAAAGAVLGVAAGMREQAVVHLATLACVAWTAPRRRVALVLAAGAGCAVTFAGPVAWLLARQPDYADSVRGWFVAMRGERAAHPYSARDFGMFLVWLAACGPVAVPLALRSLRTAWNPRLLALVAPSALQLAALAFYQDIAFSPRYLLAALPCAVVLPAGVGIDAWHPSPRVRTWLAATAVCMLVASGVVMRSLERPLREGLRDLPGRLARVPGDAAIVTGQLCPAVVQRRELARFDPAWRVKPRWVQVCPGWRWPENLATRLDGLRRDGHVVVIDLRERAWVGDRQRPSRLQAERYAQAHRDSADVIVWR